MAQRSERSHRMSVAIRRWLPSASITGASVMLLLDGGPVSTVVSGLLLALAGLMSPLAFPRSQKDAAARKAAGASGVPLIYWRPGCIYCVRLRLALGRIGNKAVWVDVSRDEDASTRVRSVNGGDETVPTVFVGGSARVNPAAAAVRAQLRRT